MAEPPLCTEVSVAPSGVPGGGNGLFARRAFEVGERLAREPILAALDAAAMEHRDQVLLASAYEKLIENGQHANLLEKGKALFRAPANDLCRRGYAQWARQTWPMYSPAQLEEVEDVMVIFAFNGFSSQPHGQYHLIYEQLSMANHSCAPNATLIAPEDGLGELVCIRPIVEGEEVLLSYLHDSDLVRPISHRRGLLQEGWNFTCTCARCASNGDDARCFSCDKLNCQGKCFVVNEPHNIGFAVMPCSCCGSVPPQEILKNWSVLENEIALLVSALPASLYSAWCPCEEFSGSHIWHWLVVDWKRYLAEYTESDAEVSEDAEEARELRNEAAKHRAMSLFATSAILGVGTEVPKDTKTKSEGNHLLDAQDS